MNNLESIPGLGGIHGPRCSVLINEENMRYALRSRSALVRSRPSQQKIVLGERTSKKIVVETEKASEIDFIGML